MSNGTLRDRLSAHARFVVETGKDGAGGVKPAHPPGWCVTAVADRGQWPAVRHLAGVVESPVLLPDGSVLTTPGYNEGTGLLLCPSGPLPSVPPAPGRADAVRACADLLEVVRDFPFASPADRSAWLAAVLTVVARHAIDGPVPLFLADGNVQGCGKGLLLDCAGRIGLGRPTAPSAYVHDSIEMRKQITSHAMTGTPIVLLDNVEGPFGNSALEAALTGSEWTDRILGGNRTFRGPLRMVWLATGNNPQPSKDMTRRTCRIRLEHPDERPEERTGFTHPDLTAWVMAERVRLLAAALTILRAFCLAGKPRQEMPAWGSFTAWSALVRGALVWAGQPDPGLARWSRAEAADPEEGNVAALMAGWAALDLRRGGKGLTCAQFLADRESCAADPDLAADPTLADSWAALAELDPKPDARSLGRLLRKYQRRNIRGFCFEQKGKAHQAARWAVVKAEAVFTRRGTDSPDSLTPRSGAAGGESGSQGSRFPAGSGNGTPGRTGELFAGDDSGPYQ
jgi:hypothetical protein